MIDMGQADRALYREGGPVSQTGPGWIQSLRIAAGSMGYSSWVDVPDQKVGALKQRAGAIKRGTPASPSTVAFMAKYDLVIEGLDVVNSWGHRTRGTPHMPAWYPGPLKNWINHVEVPWTDDAMRLAGAGMDNEAVVEVEKALADSWLDDFGKP